MWGNGVAVVCWGGGWGDGLVFKVWECAAVHSDWLPTVLFSLHVGGGDDWEQSDSV